MPPEGPKGPPSPPLECTKLLVYRYINKKSLWIHTVRYKIFPRQNYFEN